MSDFTFSLDTLLRYRRAQRDQCRALMAEVMLDEIACRQEIEQIQLESRQTQGTMRTQTETGRIDIQKQSTSRYYLSQLEAEERQVRARQERVLGQLELCRQAITQAESAVKALEKLRDKKEAAHNLKMQKRAEHELQDAWSGMQQLPR